MTKILCNSHLKNSLNVQALRYLEEHLTPPTVFPDIYVFQRDEENRYPLSLFPEWTLLVQVDDDCGHLRSPKWWSELEARSFEHRQKLCVRNLSGLPPVLWINLDRSVSRRKVMTDMFDRHKVRHERISAVDGSNGVIQAISERTSFDHPELNPTVCACSLSHLKALTEAKRRLLPTCVIMEDDIDLSWASHWEFDFSRFIAGLPSDWEIVKLIYYDRHLAFIDPKGAGQIVVRPYSRQGWNPRWSSGCYMINQRGYERILAQGDAWTQSPADWFLFAERTLQVNIPLMSFAGMDTTVHAFSAPGAQAQDEKEYVAWAHELYLRCMFRARTTGPCSAVPAGRPLDMI